MVVQGRVIDILNAWRIVTTKVGLRYIQPVFFWSWGSLIYLESQSNNDERLKWETSEWYNELDIRHAKHARFSNASMKYDESWWNQRNINVSDALTYEENASSKKSMLRKPTRRLTAARTLSLNPPGPHTVTAIAPICAMICSSTISCGLHLWKMIVMS